MAERVLFSAIEGRIVAGGAPVAGAVVIRRWSWAWTDEKGTDEAISGPDGRFTLPEVRRTSLLGSLLPHEPQIAQDIDVRHDEVVYRAWRLTKPNYERGDELPQSLRGLPLRFTCHLDAEVGMRAVAFGLCTLDAADERP